MTHALLENTLYRRRVLTLLLCLLVIIAMLLGSGCRTNATKSGPAGIETISAEFIDPPSETRPGAFWCWLNGDMTREAITRDLREMSEKGMGRAEIWDVAAVNNPDNYIPAGPQFLSDSSVALIKYAFEQGEKYGIKIGMIGSSGWNAGGTWVEPEWASKQLFYSEFRIDGPISKSLELPFPEVPRRCPKDENGRPIFSKEVAVLAIPFSEEKQLDGTGGIIDLSDRLAGNVLNAELPAGEWIIMRFICSNNGQHLIVPSPKSNGLFIDFLDPQSTRKHLGHIMERLSIPRGKKRNGGLAYIEFDSMELAAGIPWTDAMPEIFLKRRGYDLTGYLPVLAGWSIGGESDRFLYDWKKTISDQLIFSHYTTGREFLSEYGVDLVAEAGGPGPPTWDTCPVDALKALGNVTVPRGEFWVQHRHIFLVKEVASAAHIYGKKVVDAEAFTTWRRWKDSPYDLKPLVDRAFGEGLNCVTFHTFASTGPEDGLPGRTYHAGSDINHANTWWNKSGPFMDYLARCSYLLQHGLFVADACYYYGDQAPNFFPAYHYVPKKIIPEDLGEGYDYDVLNSDVILNRMSVKNGRIVLPDGMSYAVLVLPEQDDMPLRVLRKLEQLVREGATVIGPKPTEVPYLNDYTADNEALARLAGRMWEGIDGEEKRINPYGKGRVLFGLNPREVLLADGIEPDFSHDVPAALDYIHRQSGAADIYFVRNTTATPWAGVCSFRVKGAYPELWDPATGEQRSTTPIPHNDGRTHLRLELDPHGSVFVVFSADKRPIPSLRHTLNVTKRNPLTGNWRVSFPAGWGAPAEARFDTLISWTESEFEGIRYFSGTAAYHKTVTIQKAEITDGTSIVLDLGKVCDVAEVFLNGASAGVAWKPPYTVDITDLVHAGENELTIEVVNQWVNRLTGDMKTDPENRFCRTNQPYITRDDMGYDNWAEGGDETFRLKKSGLLGPVTVLFFRN